jgi:hypothetical protein
MARMKQGMKTEVHVEVAAPPEAVYAVVTDVRRMGEWSPETVQCEWLDGATGPAVGARFKGSNRRGVLRWSTKPVVVAADAGREFSFEVNSDVRWSYRFEPSGAGTRVTESFEMLRDLQWYYAVVQRLLMRVQDRRADLERAMTVTLARIKQVVEAESASA